MLIDIRRKDRYHRDRKDGTNCVRRRKNTGTSTLFLSSIKTIVSFDSSAQCAIPNACNPVMLQSGASANERSKSCTPRELAPSIRCIIR